MRVIYFARLSRDRMSSKFQHRDLWFARAYYFAFTGGWGFILPFINLFYISLGLSGTQIGTIGSVSSIVGLIVSPIIVTEIKKRPKARGILQASLVLGAIGYFFLGHQTTFLPILLIVFFQALVGSGIMPASDAMADRTEMVRGRFSWRQPDVADGCVGDSVDSTSLLCFP